MYRCCLVPSTFFSPSWQALWMARNSSERKSSTVRSMARSTRSGMLVGPGFWKNRRPRGLVFTGETLVHGRKPRVILRTGGKSMQIVPLGPGFFAEIRGLGMAEVATSDAAYAAVRAAFEAQSVLLFRDQPITDD